MRAAGVWWVRLRLLCDCGLGMGVGDVLYVRFVLVRLMGRGFMLTRMGGGLWIVRCVCAVRAARLSMLVVMYSCLDDRRICSGVGPGDRFMSDVANIVCHLLAIGVVRGSWVEEFCVRICRCSGDSSCRSLRK